MPPAYTTGQTSQNRHWGNSGSPGYDGDFRSIMAYAPGARVQRFSNPNVDYSGEATGSAGVADNAASLNSAASTVAAWRAPTAWIVAFPDTGLTVSGDAGGPFSPSSLDFTLTNLDDASANWTASSDQAWASLSSTGDTLGASASTGVTVTIESSANALGAGQHTATITFTDTTNSKFTAYNVVLTAFGAPANTQYWFPMNSDPGWTTTGDWAFGVPLGGGSNGWRLRLWKLEMQKLADETGISISVCHFPPGTSKWNKVEHRLFSFISSNWRGEPLRDYETIVKLISRTATAKGLQVSCRLDRRKYPTGRKLSDAEMKQLNLKRNKFHGEWNYTVRPRPSETI